MVTATSSRLLDEIARQSRRNEHLTVGLIAAAVSNALLVVALAGSLLGSALALLIALGIALWTTVAYLIFNAMVLRATGARELGAHEERRLRPVVTRLAGRLGIPTPRLQAIDDNAPNAFAVGTGSQATIIYTTSLLELLEDDEIEGVSAHELAHIANSDTRLALASAALLGWAIVVSAVASIIAVGLLFGGIGVLTQRSEGRDAADLLAGICLGLVLIVFAVATWLATQAWFLTSQIAHLAIFRQREWLADATAARTTGKPLALARALEKAAGTDVEFDRGHRLARALCIFGRHDKTWWDRLFRTHPDIEERIARLRSYALMR